MEGHAENFQQLGDVSELKSRTGSAKLVRPVYSQSGADEKESTGLRPNSITPISCDKFFQCNVYIFLQSLKPANCLASKIFSIQTEMYNPMSGSKRQGDFGRAFQNGCPHTGTDVSTYFPSTTTAPEASRWRSGC
jgi:hypothetical protein